MFRFHNALKTCFIFVSCSENTGENGLLCLIAWNARDMATPHSESWIICPLCGKFTENLIHGQLLSRIFYKNDLISRYICLPLLPPQDIHFNNNEGLEYVILNGRPFNDSFASIFFNIQGGARNVIPLIVHVTHFYYCKNIWHLVQN